MKRMAMILAGALLAVSAWSEAPAHFFGKGAWFVTYALGDQSAGRQIEAIGFQEGYFALILDRFPWSAADSRSWANINIQMSTGWDWRAVDKFYDDPANADVSPATAMRLTLEAAIAKTPDGPRLLAAIGVDPKQALALTPAR